MPEHYWQVADIHWYVASDATHITILMSTPEPYPAVKRFAEEEGLTLFPSTYPNEWWIVYDSREKNIEQAKLRLEQRLAKFCAENSLPHQRL